MRILPCPCSFSRTGLWIVGAALSPTAAAAFVMMAVTINRGLDLERIVAGNEPAVSGGFGSQAISHNGSGAT